MRTKFLLALAALGLAVNGASALELKNVRPSFGPQGATRTDVSCLPGDVLFVNYDIDGLKFDDKTGKANFTTILELIDPKGKVIFRKDTPNQKILQLGGTRMPGDLHVIMGRNDAPGKYTIRLTVVDNLVKESKSITYPFELLPQGFGMASVAAPAVGFPGQLYVAQYSLVDMKLDNKGNPNVIVGHRILDKDGKTPVAPDVLFAFPKDLPDEVDLSKNNFHLMQFPIYLNRPGQFTIEILAEDKNSQKKVHLKYPLTVLDFTGTAGK